MGKKHPYYGKSMSISFPDFHHTMGFVAFSRTEGNLWGNPCISHMMTSVNFFLCKGVLDKNRCNCLQYIPDLAEKSICCRENPEAATIGVLWKKAYNFIKKSFSITKPLRTPYLEKHLKRLPLLKRKFPFLNF